MASTNATGVFSSNPLLAANTDKLSSLTSNPQLTKPLPPENKPLDSYFMPHNQLLTPQQQTPIEMPLNQLKQEVTALYWNTDNSKLSTALAGDSSICDVIRDVKPQLIALADTRRHSAPALTGYTPVTLALPRKAKSGGMICYYNGKLAPHIQIHKDVPNRSLLIEIPLDQTVFLFTYLPPSSKERMRNKRCVLRWTETLKVYQAMGWRTVLMGDLNVAVPANAPKTERKAARQNKKMIVQMRTTLGLAPMSTQTPFPTSEKKHFTFIRKRQVGSAAKSHIDWALYNEGPAWRHKVPAHAIHYGDHPMCHIPISVKVGVNDISQDPFTVTAQHRLMWTGGTYDRAMFEFQDISESLEKKLRKIEDTVDTPTNKASAMWHLLQYTYFAVALHSGAARIVPVDFFHRTLGPAAPEVRRIRSQIWKAILKREEACIQDKVDLIDIDNDETPAHIQNTNDEIEKLKEKLNRAINKGQIEALERRGRKAEELMGNKKDAKHFYKVFNLKDPTSVALQRPGEPLNPSYAYQAGIVDEDVQKLFTKNKELSEKDASELADKEATSSHRPCDEPISAEELLQVINTKNRGSAGADHLDPGFFLSVTRHSLEPVLRLYNYLLDNEVIPAVMALELMTLIPKKEGITTPDRMRAICRTGIMMGTFSTCISTRIMNEIEGRLDDGITATRRRKGCPDAILAVHTAKIWAMYHSRTLIIQTLDQRKAYDSIMADAARLGLYRMMGNGKLSRIAMEIIDQRPVAITWKHHAYRPFITSRGVPQGSGVSCTLPNILINPILRKLRQDGKGVFIEDYFVGALSYVDDIVLLAEHERDAIDQQKFAESSINDDGMALNGDKHEALVTGKHDSSFLSQRAIKRLSTEYKGCKVQPTTLRYLGVFFAANSHLWEAHFAKRMGRARALIAKAQANGAYQEIPAPYTTRTLYQSFIRAAFLFAAEVAPFDDPLLANCRRLQTQALAPGLALHSGANGTLLNAILGVPPIECFIGEMKLKWWIDGIVSNQFQTQLRARRRILWSDMRMFLRKFDLRSHKRPGPQNPIFAGPTAQIVRILDDAKLTQDTFSKIRQVLHCTSAEAPANIEALLKHMKYVKRALRKYNDEKFLGAIRKSSAPISKWLLRKLRRDLLTHQAFRKKFPSKDDWVKNRKNLTTDEGVYHKLDNPPRWTCIIDDLLPPHLYRDSQRTATYRAFWALCFGLSHWHYTVPKDPSGAKRCPLCHHKVASFAAHILYRCEIPQSFRPMNAQATPMRQDNRAPMDYLILRKGEILPGWTAENLWQFAHALTKIDPDLWNLSGKHRIDMKKLGERIVEFEASYMRTDLHSLVRTLWADEMDIEATMPEQDKPPGAPAQPRSGVEDSDSDSDEDSDLELLEMLRDLRNG